ncbi:hypothetical protein CR513_54361, partial [Mucuna pruriens]
MVEEYRLQSATTTTSQGNQQHSKLILNNQSLSSQLICPIQQQHTGGRTVQIHHRILRTRRGLMG